MPRNRNRETKNTILIVCEGENTEPLYFKAIEQLYLLERNEKNIFLSLKIVTEISKPTASKVPSHKTARKERTLKETSADVYLKVYDSDKDPDYDDIQKMED